jgi:predicted glycoside hydrolase/deacetylase ChbG (UPF0249 family)
MKYLYTFLSALLLVCGTATAQQQQNQLPRLLLRVDDIGMNHAVNLGVKQLAETGMPVSASVMFACPWYQEAVEILRGHPNVAVGIHLTLNAEWKNYRWGPVAGRTAVPSLVDSLGYFLPSIDAFLKSNYKLEEVELELTAQIERALNSGLKISYLDPHMGMAVATPELRALTERLARKYSLGISAYFGETYKSMWAVPVDQKAEEFMSFVTNLQPGSINVVELHVAQQSPEMEVLVDMNSALMNTDEGKPRAAQHRQAELDMLLSRKFRKRVGKDFVLINYADLIRTNGLAGMQAPQTQ